jgi:DNA-binding MarR family transcriptional regulator
MLLRLAQAIQQQVSATYARAHGLSVAEWRMLARLNSEGSVQLATLCRALAMDKAYAGRLLRSLGAQSLVTVEADPAHGRRLIVAITPAGRALARRILPQARASQEQLLQVLDPQERAALYASLKKLQAALDDTAPQPASHATEQPAQQLAARLFEVLRGQPHAHGGEEILTCPESSS